MSYSNSSILGMVKLDNWLAYKDAKGHRLAFGQSTFYEALAERNTNQNCIMQYQSLALWVSET